MIQTPGRNVFFDLGIPRIGLDFSEPLCELALFRVRELLNLGLNLGYSARVARLHPTRILVTPKRETAAYYSSGPFCACSAGALGSKGMLMNFFATDCALS